MVRTILAVPRTVIALFVIALATIVLGGYAIVLVRFRPDSPQVAPVMRLWSRLLLWLSGVSWTVEGLEHLDPAAAYVVVSNHTSNLDPPFHMAALPLSIRFLAKKELFRIPVFGRAMRAVGIVETDRAAHASAHRAINQQVRRNVARGLSLMIYPEGTRSRDAEVHDFKKGAFRIAVENGLPVVPVATTGTHRAWPPGGRLIRGGRARMVINPPIPTVDLTSDDLEELRDRVRRVVEMTYEEVR